ncbi:unnamed protein product [Adineta steineri]|nr:unnamed protein product [Adineta steineri]CAF1275539.1 unnamed protein product [Adineta steineri]CAF3525121.1 unnamed protein product [Adineta steineri]CAF3825600.1 unnamed protein product [Adineta steineri]
MVFEMFKRMNDNLRRRIRRAILAEPDKMPQRYAILMASVLFLSIIVTYNVLFEKEKRKEGYLNGVKPPSVMDVFRDRSAKQKLEHIELQRNIMQARNNAKTTTVNDL